MKRFLSIAFSISLILIPLGIVGAATKIPFQAEKVSPILALKGISFPSSPSSAKRSLIRYSQKINLGNSSTINELFVEFFIGLFLTLGKLDSSSESIQGFIEDCKQKNVILYAGFSSAAVIKDLVNNLLSLVSGYENDGCALDQSDVSAVFFEKLNHLKTAVDRKAITVESINELLTLVNCFFDELYAIEDSVHDGFRRHRLIPLNDQIHLLCEQLLGSRRMIGCRSKLDYEKEANFLEISKAILTIYEVLGFVPSSQQTISLVVDSSEVFDNNENFDFFYQVEIGSVVVVLIAIISAWMISEYAY